MLPRELRKLLGRCADNGQHQGIIMRKRFEHGMIRGKALHKKCNYYIIIIMSIPSYWNEWKAGNVNGDQMQEYMENKVPYLTDHKP